MPTKVFDALDVASSIHTDVGHLDYITTNNVPNDVDISTMLSLVADGSFDVTFNFNSTGNGGVNTAVRHQWVGAIHTNTLEMDYEKPITGLPAGALIKSMVIRSPWNCNIDMLITKSAGFFTAGMTKTMRVRKEVIVNGVTNSRQFGTVTTTTQALQLIDEEINADADIEIFNFTNPEDYIPLIDFVADYSQIILKLKQEGVADLDTFQRLGAGTPAGTDITGSCIYTVSFHTGWTITVGYEEGVSWELTSPAENQAVGPGDTIVVTGLAPEPLDPEEILTLEIALLDKDGNEVGVRVPITEWDATSTVLSFILPNFQQSVNIQQIVIYMTSTQFTGSVALQRMWAIYFYNAPGVYTFTSGQAYDTYYDRDEAVINTVNTRIPNPGGRTGYY